MAQQEFKATAVYPGLSGIVSLSYTCAHGVSPGIATIECQPQLSSLPALSGNLIVYFGPTGTSIPVFRLRDCRLDMHSIQKTQQNLIWRVSLHDRRWKWGAGCGVNGPISGNYNSRLDDNTIDPSRQQSPRNLATLLLLAMGETNFDVSQLPNDSLPLVQWDHDNAAKMLADLAEEFGCRVVFDPVSDSVIIAQTGVGANLSPNGIIERTGNIAPATRPDSIMICAGRSRYQADLALEAVGMDVDGSIQLLSNLSYIPTIQDPNNPGKNIKTFAFDDPQFFSSVSLNVNPVTGEVPRNLARQTVFRWYRIKVPFRLPGWGTDFSKWPQLPSDIEGNQVNDIRQIALESEQVETCIDPVSVPGSQITGIVKNRHGQVYGQYYRADQNLTAGDGNGNTLAGTICDVGFSIDADRGIVMFDQAVLLRDPVNGLLPANIYLRTAMSVRDQQTWTWDRLTLSLFYPDQNGTGPRVLKHDEITLNVYGIYDTQTKNNILGPGTDAPVLKSLSANAAVLIQEMQYYLAAADFEYQTNVQESALYQGLVGANLDGAIQQVTWQFDTQYGATTRISRNNEFQLGHPPYRERRAWERWNTDLVNYYKKQQQNAALSPQMPRKGMSSVVVRGNAWASVP